MSTAVTHDLFAYASTHEGRAPSRHRNNQAALPDQPLDDDDTDDMIEDYVKDAVEYSKRLHALHEETEYFIGSDDSMSVARIDRPGWSELEVSQAVVATSDKSPATVLPDMEWDLATMMKGERLEFEPMAMTRCWATNGREPDLTEAEENQRRTLGLSNYKGNPELPGNYSANIPPSQNCSLWITNLPPDVTIPELILNLGGLGRLFSVHINPPSTRLSHETSAAKVVFFEKEPAQYLANLGRGLLIRGYRARIMRNRIRVAESFTQSFSTDQYGNKPSRVIRITGPSTVVQLGALERFFMRRFYYGVEGCTVWGDPSEGYTEIELRFGSFYCQAQSAFMAITRHEYSTSEKVDVYYARDPCDPMQQPHDPGQGPGQWNPGQLLPLGYPGQGQLLSLGYGNPGQQPQLGYCNGWEWQLGYPWPRATSAVGLRQSGAAASVGLR